MVDYSEIGSAVFAQEEVRKNYWKSRLISEDSRKSEIPASI